MREYPLFVPYGDEHIAVVLTVPDSDPVGLVALLTGGSSARSHLYGVWTRTARRLADERGLASIRFDYLGTGDSTGILPEWRLANMPVDQVLAAIRFGMSAAGVDRLAITGFCMGGRVGLSIAADAPDCAGAILVRVPVLEPSGVSDAVRRARAMRLASALDRRLKREGVLRRLLRPLVRRKRKASPAMRRGLASALDHGRLLLLYDEEDFTFGTQVRRALDRIIGSLSEAQRGNYELRVLPGRGMQALQSQEIQEELIDAIVGWSGDLFGPARTADGVAPARS